MHAAAISSSSARESTLPVGLCGELSSSTRAFGVIAAASASGSIAQSGARSVTGRRTAPAIAIPAA